MHPAMSRKAVEPRADLTAPAPELYIDSVGKDVGLVKVPV